MSPARGDSILAERLESRPFKLRLESHALDPVPSVVVELVPAGEVTKVTSTSFLS